MQSQGQYSGIERVAFRNARAQAGLTQSELAARARVSRQLVGAIEAGRHVPAVDAALRLARALGSSVEQLFAAATPGFLTVLEDERLADGDLVRASQVEGRLVAARVDAVGAGGAWNAVDGIVDGGELRLLPGADTTAAVVVGCDPVLGIAEGLLAGGGRRLLAVSASTGRGLAALETQRCHAAVVHGEPQRLRPAAVAVSRWHLARWRVGLAVHPSLAGKALETLLSGVVAVAQRDAGAASQQAFARARERLGLVEPVPGPVVRDHLAGAAEALRNRCAAVSIEPAALALGLAFVPFETHAVELWVARSADRHRGVEALLDVLASPAFQARAALLAGYDLDGCGSACAA